MTVSEIRTLTGLSQAEFAKKYNIPGASIKNWEQGKRSCPDYVVELLEHRVLCDVSENEKMQKEALELLKDEIDKCKNELRKMREEPYVSIDGEKMIASTVDEFMIMEWIKEHFKTEAVNVEFTEKNRATLVDRNGNAISVEYDKRKGVYLL